MDYQSPTVSTISNENVSERGVAYVTMAAINYVAVVEFAAVAMGVVIW